MLVHCEEITDKNENKNYLAPPWWKMLAAGAHFHNVDQSCSCIHLSVAIFSARCTRPKHNDNAQRGYATTREHRVMRQWVGWALSWRARENSWRIRFEGWADCFLVAESGVCHSLLILTFSVFLTCQRVERSSDDPLRSPWMWERTEALNVLPGGLSSYKLMRGQHFGSFWVARWWVRETEAGKEHRFQAIQPSALLVNDSRSVTHNVNITKIQLCCSTLDFWNKTQDWNECVFCCNIWLEVHALSGFSSMPSTLAIT